MILQNKTFDQERALYGTESITLENCRFEGAADGESALKESRDVTAKNCVFALRYPFWHTEKIFLSCIRMEETCRAALWYCKDVTVKDSVLHGVKALRECADIRLAECDISSAEFGWFSRKIDTRNCDVSGEYAFLHAKDISAEEMRFAGKYSFQYVENVTLRNCVLKTKDAFWHSRAVTVYDSVIEGEYLGWYSENLRLVRCHIKGTQPLCYARGLILEDCTMENADLAFEKSEVEATVRGEIVSIKAPKSGNITVEKLGALLPENDGSEGGARVTVQMP